MARNATSTTATAPTRATWKGHGNPALVTFFGKNDTQPNTEGVPATVTIDGGAVRVLPAGRGARPMYFGVAAKFWAAPAPRTVPTRKVAARAPPPPPPHLRGG